MVIMSSIAYSLLAAPLLAQAGGQTFADSWAVVLLCVFLGLTVALLPARRTSEIKRPRDD
jgi:hypothetical protein